MKKLLTCFCLGAFLVVGIYAAVDMAAMPRTYDGQNATVSLFYPTYPISSIPSPI